MIPVLFKGNETNFNHNGIGLLKDTLSCEVSEVRNGSFDLELVYPITGSYFKDLKNGNIIQAKPNDTDQPHNFRITEIDKTLSDKEVVVYGVSTTNDLGGNMVKSLYLEDLTPQVILNEMKNALHYPTTFNFVSNITTIGSVNWELNNPLNLIVGEEGSLVDIFGGEVKRTNDTVYLYGRRGKDNVTTIRAGKNLDGFKMTESFQGKYTQILPYFKYEAEVSGEVSGGTEGETIRQEVTVFGSIVSSPYHGRYPVNAIKPIDFSQNELVRESKSLDSLNSVASKYFSNLYSEIDKPSVSINVDMIQLVDSEQYALYEKLEKIELTDTVSVYVSEYDVDVLVKITELKYDSLRERTISIVASSSSSGRTSLMDEISGSYKQFTTTLVDDKIQSATSGIINQILTQKNGSNMYAGRATPPENSKPGDIWFKDTGGGDVELYEFDGVNWVRKMYKGFGDDVRQLVDDKIAESNALFTGALEEQEAAVEQANALAQLAKTTATNASLSASAANQDAQKALADAANAKTEALAQFSMVSQALDTAETKINQLIGDVSSKVSQTDYNTLNGRVTNAESNISQQATQIASKVSQTDFNSEKTKISNLQTSVTQQAGQIALKANATDLNLVTNRLSTAEGSITTQAGQIALKAEKTYVDTVKQTVDSTTSRVTLTEQSITSLVSGSKTLPDGRTSVFATKIESLEGAITQRVTTQELNAKGYQTSTDVTNTINGRTDLARKTDIPKTSGGRNLAQKTSSEWSTPYASFYGTTNNCPNLYKIIIDDLAVGDILKSRIVLKYTDIIPASGKTATIYLQGDGNITGWGSGGYYNTSPIPISGSGEMIFEHEFKITDNHLKNEYLNWMFRTDYIASGSLQWRLAKVEKGPLWTAWTPAPEDAEADLTDRLSGYVTNQTYTTYTTARQQTDQQITEQINQTVSKVPTGPVNLIVNSFDPQTISPWTFDGNGHNLILATHDFFYNSQKKLYMLYTNNTVEGYAYTNVFNLKRNAKYTLRIGLFAGAATRSCDIHFIGKPAGGDFSYQHLRLISDLSPSKVVYYTMTFDSGSFDLGQFRIDNNGSKTQGTQAALYICEVSCIEGEYNNSWTPSYDELITEQKFNETKSTVDSFSRAIGTRDETGFVPNIARLVMTQDSVISEVAKYGEHNSNLIVDAGNHSQTVSINGATLTKYPKYDRIDFSISGATNNTWAGFECKVNNTRFRTGEKYTVSFEYYLHSAPDATVEIELKDGNTWLSGVHFATASTATGTWHTCQHTFTITNNSIPNSNNIRLKAWVHKNGSVAIQKLMLVRGEKIGPYSTSQVDSVTSRVEQTANSYSVKFLNNANDITTQLNLTSSGARIKSSLIHLDGNVTVSGTAWMDGAIIKNLSADKITTGTLNANNVNITNLSVNSVSGITATYLQSVIGTAFIDWMKGKTITAMNGNMAIDLNNAKITFNADAKIQFNSDDNALFRTKNGTSAFIHFRDDVYNGVYTAMGVNADDTGTQNDYVSGSFAGVRVIRTNPNRYSGTIVDQVQIVADEVRIRHAYGYEHDYLTIIWDNGSKIDLVKWMRQFNTNFQHLVNLTGRGDVIKSF